MPAQTRSLSTDAEELLKAAQLIHLGARMQVLEAEFKISRDKLLRLYREVTGISPPKGMLPFSTDWYLTWGPNIHSSLFMNTYGFLQKHSNLGRVDLLIRAYGLYCEHFDAVGQEPVVSLTRAWTLLRFFDAELLRLAPCTKCHGRYVAHQEDLVHNLVCGICQPPSRAGKTKGLKARDTAVADTSPLAA